MTAPTRLNIVHICDHLGWTGSRMHGVKRLFAWMIPRFDPSRFNVSLISLRTKDLSEDTLEQFGIDVTYLHRGKFDPATLPSLVKVLDAKKADIVHLHGYGATTFGRVVAGWRKIPAILHEHANHTSTPWFQQIADRALAPYTDLAIAVSRSTAEFVIRARKVPAEKTRVVYLGVPLEEFARPRSADEIARARLELGVPDGTLAIGTITRLMPAKGNTYFVQAFKAVSQKLPDARGFIIGEGELGDALKAEARALGLEGRLTFAGFKHDVAAALSALDIVVFPSLAEGTPLTAFEALAMGKPIVSTDADGLKDILTAGRDAVIMPRANSAALAEAIVSLAAAPDRRARLAAEARVTGARYDIRAFVEKMERLYVLLHDTAGRHGHAGLLREDLSFLQ
jgi:glycosyltransferase involved in cell wall biosynthesis